MQDPWGRRRLGGASRRPSARLLLLLWASISLQPALAETARTRAARLELEQELRATVTKPPPPKLEIFLQPLPDPNLQLVEVRVLLDGRALPIVPLSQIDLTFDEARVWTGKISPGQHRIEVQQKFKGRASYGRSYGVDLAGAIKLTAQAGLAVAIRPRVQVNPREENYKKRFSFKLAVEPRMLAKLDTSSIPDHRAPLPPEPDLPEASVPPESAEATGELLAEADPEDAARARAPQSARRLLPRVGRKRSRSSPPARTPEARAAPEAKLPEAPGPEAAEADVPRAPTPPAPPAPAPPETLDAASVPEGASAVRTTLFVGALVLLFVFAALALVWRR